MKNIAVVGAGIVGICTSFFLQKSGFKVTVFDKEPPGSMTSYGHACTFANYANVPVNSPSLFRDIPSMLFRSEGPLAIDFFYLIKHLPWAFKFLMNCRKDRVKEISSSLADILHHSRLSYDHIFEEVNVSEYIKNEENIYIYDSKKSYDEANFSNLLRKNNNIQVKELSKKEVYDLEPSLAPVYHAGQLFIGSRHTTNPLAISKKYLKVFYKEGENTLTKMLKM
jgi:D-amino-acid dehydrogenase